MIRTAAAWLKLAAFALDCAWVIPSQSLVLLLHKGPCSYVLPRLWHRACCAIFGLKFKVIGTPYSDGQVIYAGNHVSYLDISVIGSVLKASFIAKNDLAKWPLFGFLATLQQAAFIERSRQAAGKEKSALETYLAEGKNLILFPEGTSSDGTAILPFKSSFFSLAFSPAARPGIVVQPMTLRLENAATREDRDLYAWYGDMTLEPHLWAFARSRGATVSLIFHPPLRVSDFRDRKELARACEAAVSAGLAGPDPSTRREAA